MVLNFKINNLLLVGFLLSYSMSGVLLQILNLSSYILSLLSMFLFILLLLFVNINNNYIKINLKYLMFIFLIFLAIYFEIIFSIYLYGDLKLEKAFSSLYFLFAFLFIVPIIVHFIYLKEILFKRIFLIIYIFFSSILYFVYFLNERGILYGKNVLIFCEPSHAAIVLVPISLFVNSLIDNVKIKVLNIMNIFILSILLENATLFLGSFFVSIMIFKRKFFFLLLILFILIFLFIILDINKRDYFISRLTLNTESYVSNLSTLVFLSGFERAYLSLMDSNFIGVGFNRMGYAGPMGEYQKILDELGYFELNLFDGGTTASKLITETGILGITLLLLYIYGFIKVFFRLEKYITISDKLFIAYYISFSFELFIRGIGYFSPNLILLLASVYYLFFLKKRNHERRLQCSYC